eukprot:TRINITY_DN11166_c0_g1_i1.p1 TRINITY_DN11166_c0_g1~~TRINITY_DN11166_c0_g1_i1.p1  ORF type:complete len:274 (+),score=46.73 TRINITY_DN11166_c0_g1_i1:517-1338(+)
MLSPRDASRRRRSASARGTFFFQAEDGIRDFCLSRGLGDVYKRQIRAFPVVLLALLSSSALLANADCFANFTERVEQKRKILWYNRYKSLDHAVYIETDTNVFNNASETKALIQSLLADGSYYMTKNKDYCAAMAPIIQSQLDSTFNYVCKADYEVFKNEWPAFRISLKDWVEFCVQSKARDPASISRIQKSPFKGSAECNKRLDEIVGNLTQIFENRKGREALRKEHENLNHAESKGCFEKAKVCVSARNFFFSSRRRHTRFLPVSWARRCV